MKVFFYLTHTLYAKVLIPLIIKLVQNKRNVCISKNKPDFFRYSPRIYGGNPVSNRFVNNGSFDFVADISGYSDEWNAVKHKLDFSFFCKLDSCDAVIGTTKNLDMLKKIHKKYSKKEIFAVGYQHMPFLISLNKKLRRRNRPEACLEVFTKPNPFSVTHGFADYIEDFDLSFRSFSYLEKAYEKYFPNRDNNPKKYVLIFHPGGYRGVVTEIGDPKETCFKKQKDFFITICSPILESGLVPVIKTHPLAARYHFKEDVLEILGDISKDRKDFSRIIVEDKSYYPYVYGSDTVVTFGSSGIYELLSMGMKNFIVCGFFGSSRSKKFSFMEGIYIDSKRDYADYWKRQRDLFFKDTYESNNLLHKIQKAYELLFSGDISDQILLDTGLI